VRVRSPQSVRAARVALARVLRQGRCDVAIVHSAWALALFGPIVRRSGARLVQYLHEAPNRNGWLDRWASRTAPDLVVCNSRYCEAGTRWWFPRTPHRTIRCPVALGPGVGAAERARVRASLDTSDDAVVVVTASRMEKWKGHELLLDALAKLRVDRPWVCWIAGGAQRPHEVEYVRQLHDRARALGLEGRVRFLGQRTDVPALMSAADIHCQPNTGPEPFGLTFVEALAAGVPVVTTGMGGPLEIVSPDCGILAPCDAAALADALSSLIVDEAKRRAMAAAGPARARELCDVGGRMRELAEELSGLGAAPQDAERRARLSEGHSSEPILSGVQALLRSRASRFDTLVDLGCGGGDGARRLDALCGTYIGGDIARYDSFPASDRVRFRQVDLNRTPYPFLDASADAVVSIETIEHVENPRALVREMARIVRPGGWNVVTTPNQLSITSKLYLVTKNQFHAFQEAPGLYPAHITALVEADLRHIAAECGLVDVVIRYTDHGRVPLMTRHWPSKLGLRGRWFSDNVAMMARRP
jgi:glycosyltransferase involved in cell wall biosynthesis